MFEVGFTELMLIGLIALLVLGPERLPPLVRSTGRWLGRAQRMVRELKTQLENETGFKEIQQFKQTLQREDLAASDDDRPKFPGAGANLGAPQGAPQDSVPKNPG